MSGTIHPKVLNFPIGKIEYLEVLVTPEKLPGGLIRTTADLGRLVAGRRKAQGLTQAELAGLGQTGSRFIGELERGKGTVQCDKVLHVLNLLGLDVLIVERGG